MTRKLYSELVRCCFIVDVLLLYLGMYPMMIAMPLALGLVTEGFSWGTLLIGCVCVTLMFLVHKMLRRTYSTRMLAVIREEDCRVRRGERPLTKVITPMGVLVVFALMVGLMYVYTMTLAFHLGCMMPNEILAGLGVSTMAWSRQTGGMNQWLYDGISRFALKVDEIAATVFMVLHIVIWRAERYGLTDDETVQKIR